MKMRHPSVGAWIDQVVYSLDMRGRYSFADSLIDITKVRLSSALAAYENTLRTQTLTIELEPLSATMCKSARIEWKAEKADVGVRVHQIHTAEIREQMRPLVDEWVRRGKAYPTSGGAYGSIPNKSFQRIKDLSKVPELRDAVLNLGIEDRWKRLFDVYVPMRYEASAQLLSLLKSGRDPEALSRGNEEAGMGLSVKGIRLKRKDAFRYANQLDFLLDYQRDAAIAFAASQLAVLEPDQVFMITVKHPWIKGAIAARSDVDVKDVLWDGRNLTIIADAGTRQVGADGSGALANSSTEKKYSGASVSEHVLRQLQRPNVFYPNIKPDKLLEFWATGVDPRHPPYVLGQDLGLSEPVKAGADNLFSRAFVKVGTKVLPHMLSGVPYTNLAYQPFHDYYAEKFPDSEFVDQGDDLNVKTSNPDGPGMFKPYDKIKSTQASTGHKKILGFWFWIALKKGKTPIELAAEDPDAVMGVIPRAIKTLSSASKRGSRWQELLSKQPLTGKLDITVDPATEIEMAKTLPLVLPFSFWKGKQSELLPMLKGLWGKMTSETRLALQHLKDDLDHRIAPFDLQPPEEVADADDAPE